MSQELDQPLMVHSEECSQWLNAHIWAEGQKGNYMTNILFLLFFIQVLIYLKQIVTNKRPQLRVFKLH